MRMGDQNRALLVLLAVTVAIVLCLALLRTRPAQIAARKLTGLVVERIEEQYGVALSFQHVAVRYPGVVLEGVSFNAPAYPALRGTTQTVGIDVLKRVVRVSGGELAVGTQRLSFQGQLGLGRMVGELSFGLPPTSCQDLLEASPPFVQERMKETVLRGRLTFDLDAAFDELQPEKVELSAALEEGCEIERFGNLPRPEMFRGPFIHAAYRGDGKPFELHTGPGTARWAKLGGISPFMIDAVIEAEDPLFWRHNGILLPRVKTALAENLKHGKPKYGASTVTMQLAKNLFLTREKTASRKALEVFFTWYLERFFTKSEILELYLNVAEFGPSIYGITEAANRYFGRGPGELSLAEAAYLAKLLPAPVSRHSDYAEGEVSADTVRRMRRLLHSMLVRGKITEQEYQEASTERLVFWRPGEDRPAPRLPIVRGTTDLSSLGQLRRSGAPKLSGARAPLDMLLEAEAELVEVRPSP
jgi:hypothetical protein